VPPQSSGGQALSPARHSIKREPAEATLVESASAEPASEASVEASVAASSEAEAEAPAEAPASIT